MANLQFLELLIVSRVERASRRVKFNKRVTIVKGDNDTGKSSLMKSIYWSLGAEPANIHPRWISANPVCSLKFDLNGTKYRIIRDGSRITLFDQDDEVIRTYGSVTNDLAPHFAELFSFHLTLASNNEDKQATPAFLFLPYYVDQDQGWQRNLNSFSRLGQFQRWRGDVVSFHTGIKPSEYYIAKAELRDLSQRENELIQQRSTLERVLDGIRKRLEAVDFDLDIDAFKKEIEQLLERSKKLRTEENKLRRKLVDAFNAKQAIADQLEIVRGSLNELRADRRFAETSEDEVTCPTCQATYENGFAERFSIAVDEDSCIQLIVELEEKLKSSVAHWENSQQLTTAAAAAAQSIEDLLTKKRSKVALQDVLRREGQKDVSEAINAEIASIDQRIGEVAAATSSLEGELKELNDKNRAKMIRESYLAKMSYLLGQLNVVNIPESSYKRLDANIKESGSDLPRAILAYYLALNATIAEHGSSTRCPLVIDSPRQQDQDETNWEQMLNCLRDERPEGQLVLALIDDMDVDFGGSIIELKNKNQLLQRQGYNAAIDELRPLIDASVFTEE